MPPETIQTYHLPRQHQEPEQKPVESVVFNPRPMSVIERYINMFGPHAFGVFSLLIIWYLIVGPELAASRKTSEVVTGKIHDASLALKEASIRLEGIVNRLEK